MGNSVTSTKDIVVLDSVIEPITISVILLSFVAARFLELDASVEMIYYLTVASGLLFVIYWYHIYPLKKYDQSRIAYSIPIYSLLISVLSHLTGGINSPIFLAFFMPIIVSAYGLPPFFVTTSTVIPSLYIAFELIFLSYSSNVIDPGEYANGVIKSLLVIFISTFTYVLSIQRVKVKEKLDESVNTLETKDIRQKEVITELIDTERLLRLEQQQLEVRNKELVIMRRSMLNILDDLENERIQIEIERNKFESVLQSTSEGIMMVDQDKRLVLVNKSFESMFNLDNSELKGMTSEEYSSLAEPFFRNEEDYNLWAEEISNNQITRETDWEVDSKPPLYIKRFTTPVRGERRKRLGRIWTFRDVTRDKEIDKMRSEFVSLASHQLRTPISAIKWLLEMVLNGDVGKLKPKQKDLLEKTYKSSERMTDLIDSLLNISRIESGKITINPKSTDIVALIESYLEQLKLLAQEKKQRLTFTFDKKIPLLNLDKRLIGESVNNLISNSIKYTPIGGKIEIEVKKKKTNIEISVKDNGSGIPKKEHSRVFEKFYRSDKAISSETEGSGLGLFIVKSVIDSSGGKVWFESKEGKGSVFYISLPLKGSEKVEGTKTLS